jgi:hypothetical protein
MGLDMNVYGFIDTVFIVAVIISGFSLCLYLAFGVFLAKKMRLHMNKAMDELGNPWGVSTILMRNTSLYDDFLKTGCHKESEFPQIRKLGEMTILAKNFFHYASLICMVCLISLLALK